MDTDRCGACPMLSGLRNPGGAEAQQCAGLDLIRIGQIVPSGQGLKIQTTFKSNLVQGVTWLYPVVTGEARGQTPCLCCRASLDAGLPYGRGIAAAATASQSIQQQRGRQQSQQGDNAPSRRPAFLQVTPANKGTNFTGSRVFSLKPPSARASTNTRRWLSPAPTGATRRAPGLSCCFRASGM